MDLGVTRLTGGPQSRPPVNLVILSYMFGVLMVLQMRQPDCLIFVRGLGIPARAYNISSAVYLNFAI